jgi:hypothetical protein
VDGVVRLGEAIGLIVWYICYVLIVILGREYRQYMKRRRGVPLGDSSGEKIAMEGGKDDEDALDDVDVGTISRTAPPDSSIV